MALNKTNNNNWISISDIMTGLMVIFMFIALSYILEVQNRERNINKIIQNYRNTQIELYNELDQTFTKQFEEWNLQVNPDLSIQINDASALFPIQTYDQVIELTKRFESFLDRFTPQFFDIILKEQYINDISAVRIEGHTAIHAPFQEFSKDYYQKMLVLSQKRSNKVLDYMMNLPYYDKLHDSQKSLLRFIITSNGFAFGKALDQDGKFKFETKKPISGKKSMRVEFRIVTNNQKVIDEWIQNQK